MKITKRKLKAWIMEERKSAKEYEKYGFFDIAKDERRHAKILSIKLRMID